MRRGSNATQQVIFEESGSGCIPEHGFLLRHTFRICA